MAIESLQALVTASENRDICDVIIESDCVDRGVTQAESLEKMRGLYAAIRRAQRGYDPKLRSASGMVGGDGHVYMPEDGVLLSVSAVSGEQAAKDAVLATYCPKDTMRLVCSVDEQDLSELAVGDVMQVTLDAYEDKPLRGTIAKIASASGDDGTSTSFDVTIELEANDLIRIGMSASAEK